MSPKISAIISTYNRAQQLRLAIQSLIDQTLPVEDYEIIVVNNASTDNTAKLVEIEFAHVPNLVYLHEPKQGLSHTRNAGWKKAKSDYIAFLDDDAVAAPLWLENILKGFFINGDNVVCVGGKVEPFWSLPRPKWLKPDIEYFLGLIDLGDEKKLINKTGHYIAGVNSAYQKKFLEKISGFPIFLGRTSKGLMQGEDTFVQKTSEKYDLDILYDPGIRVWHYVSRDRLRKRYFINWAYSSGLALSTISCQLKPIAFRQRISKILGLFRRLFLTPKNILILITPICPDRLFSRKCMIYLDLGKMVGLLSFTTNAKETD